MGCGCVCTNSLTVETGQVDRARGVLYYVSTADRALAPRIAPHASSREHAETIRSPILFFNGNGISTVADRHTIQPTCMRGTFQKYRQVRSTLL